MFFSTIFFNLWIDIFHQCVPLHQHIRESRAGKNTDNFWAYRRKIGQVTIKYFINGFFIHDGYEEQNSSDKSIHWSSANILNSFCESIKYFMDFIIKIVSHLICITFLKWNWNQESKFELIFYITKHVILTTRKILNKHEHVV